MDNRDRRIATETASAALDDTAAAMRGSTTEPGNLTVVELLRGGGFSFARDIIATVESLMERDAYDLDGAAARTSLGRTTIKDAIEDGELVAHYAGKKKTKPIIYRADLESWVKNLPTEPRAS